MKCKKEIETSACFQFLFSVLARLNKTDRLMDQLSEAINDTIEEVKKPDLSKVSLFYA